MLNVVTLVMKNFHSCTAPLEIQPALCGGILELNLFNQQIDFEHLIRDSHFASSLIPYNLVPISQHFGICFFFLDKAKVEAN